MNVNFLNDKKRISSKAWAHVPSNAGVLPRLDGEQVGLSLASWKYGAGLYFFDVRAEVGPVWAQDAGSS